MSSEVLTIDGSYGEGGGQILRSSLALSMVTQTPFRIENIRAGRKKPGLMRQHLTCVQAAKQVCSAQVTGDHLGSQCVSFVPGPVMPGHYRFSIGSAGSTTLVLQTILPGLVLADQTSELTLCGGTHNMMAPPFDFLAKSFLPQLNKMGPNVQATLVRPGFFPAGGGEIKVNINPCNQLRPLVLTERGEITHKKATATVSKLPIQIADRELNTLRRKLNWPADRLKADEVKDAHGPGNIITLEVGSAEVCEVITGFGEINKAAERVATEVAKECQKYIKSGAPVGEHLADQIMLPLAIAAHQNPGGQGKSSYMISQNSGHTQTHAELVSQFLNCKVTIEPVESDNGVKSKACMVHIC